MIKRRAGDLVVAIVEEKAGTISEFNDPNLSLNKIILHREMYVITGLVSTVADHKETLNTYSSGQSTKLNFGNSNKSRHENVSLLVHEDSKWLCVETLRRNPIHTKRAKISGGEWATINKNEIWYLIDGECVWAGAKKLPNDLIASFGYPDCYKLEIITDSEFVIFSSGKKQD